MLCSSCGSTVVNGHRFCANCGAKQPELCNFCGQIVPDNARFCTNCGTPMGAKTNIPNISSAGSSLPNHAMPVTSPIKASKPRQLRYRGAIESIALSPNGLYLASGDLERLCVWRVSDGSIQSSWDGIGYQSAQWLAFLADNQTVVMLGTRINIIQSVTGKITLSMEPPRGTYFSKISFSSDSKHAIITTMDAKVYIWKPFDRSLSNTLEQASSFGPESISVHPNGLSVSATDTDKTYIWSLQTGKLLHIIDNIAGEIVHSPDGKTIAVGDASGEIHFIEAASGVVKKSINYHSSWINAIAWTQNNILITASNDQTICIWDTKTDELRCRIRCDSGIVRHMSCSTDGSTIAGLIEDGIVDIWRLSI